MVDHKEIPTGSLVVLTLVSTILITVLPLWFITLAIAPVSIYIAAKQRGAAFSAFLLFLASILLWIIFSGASLPIIATLTILGYLPAFLKIAAKPGSRIALSIIILTMVYLSSGLAIYYFNKQEVKKLMTQEIQIIKKQLKKQADLSTNKSQDIEKEVDRLIVGIRYIIVGAIVLCVMCVVVLNYLLTQQAALRFGYEWEKLPPFSDWQLPWYLSYGFLAALVFTFFDGYFGTFRSIVYAIGLNLFLVFGFMYFIQGLAIINFNLTKLKLGLVGKTLAIAMFLVFQILIQGITWLGLLDTWFNFRKLADKTQETL